MSTVVSMQLQYCADLYEAYLVEYREGEEIHITLFEYVNNSWTRHYVFGGEFLHELTGEDLRVARLSIVSNQRWRAAKKIYLIESLLGDAIVHVLAIVTRYRWPNDLLK